MKSLYRNPARNERGEKRKNAVRRFFTPAQHKKTDKRNAYRLYGADDQIRTGDLILTKDALYRLSYISLSNTPR